MLSVLCAIKSARCWTLLCCNNIEKCCVHFHYIWTMVSLGLLHSCHIEHNGIASLIDTKCEGIYLVTVMPSGNVQHASLKPVTTWPHSFTMWSCRHIMCTCSSYKLEEDVHSTNKVQFVPCTVSWKILQVWTEGPMASDTTLVMQQ